MRKGSAVACFDLKSCCERGWEQGGEGGGVGFVNNKLKPKTVSSFVIWVRVLRFLEEYVSQTQTMDFAEGEKAKKEGGRKKKQICEFCALRTISNRRFFILTFVCLCVYQFREFFGGVCTHFVVVGCAKTGSASFGKRLTVVRWQICEFFFLSSSSRLRLVF